MVPSRQIARIQTRPSGAEKGTELMETKTIIKEKKAKMSPTKIKKFMEIAARKAKASAKAAILSPEYSGERF